MVANSPRDDIGREPAPRVEAPIGARPRRRSGRRLRFVRQMRSQGCAGACLTMVFDLHGADGWGPELDLRLGRGERHTDAQTLIDVAGELGMEGVGFALTAEEALGLPCGSILHWEANHYVVFDRGFRDDVHIVDPRFGRRVLTRAEFGERFSGVAIVFSPTANLRAAGPGARVARGSLSSQLGLGAGAVWSARLANILERSLFAVSALSACRVIAGAAPLSVEPGLFLPLSAVSVLLMVASARLKWAIGCAAFAATSGRVVDSLVRLPPATIRNLQDADILGRTLGGFELRAAVAGLIVSGPAAVVVGAALAGALALYHPALFAVLLSGLLLQALVFIQSLVRTESLSNEVAAQRAALTRAEHALVGRLRSPGEETRALGETRRWRDLFPGMAAVVARRDGWNALGTSGVLGVNVLTVAATACWSYRRGMSGPDRLASAVLVALALREMGALLSALARRARVLGHLARVEDLVEGGR